MRHRTLTHLVAIATTILVTVAVMGATPAGAADACSGPDGASIDRLYAAYFLRDSDDAGAGYWHQLRHGGRALDDISAEFARSPEFQSRYGTLTDAGFVDLVYRNVLDRAPDGGGRTWWEGRLAAGESRGAIMRGFADSAEFKARSGLTGDPAANGPAALPTENPVDFPGTPYVNPPELVDGAWQQPAIYPAGTDTAAVGAELERQIRCWGWTPLAADNGPNHVAAYRAPNGLRGDVYLMPVCGARTVAWAVFTAP